MTPAAADRLDQLATRRGRRSVNDAAALAVMADFNFRRLARGENPNDREAARDAIRVLGLDDSHVQDGAIEDRLRRKFSRLRDALMAQASVDRGHLNPNKSQDRDAGHRVKDISLEEKGGCDGSGAEGCD